MNFYKINKYLNSKVIEKYKTEFSDEMIKMGVYRVKVLTVILIVFEIIMIIVSAIIEKEKIFNTPRIYYIIMYVVMIINCIAYFILFSKIEKSKIIKRKTIKRIFYAGACFILMWSIGITLLDQISYGQTTVYFTAIIGVALFSSIKPIDTLIINISVNIIFIICLPFFQKNHLVLLGNYINTSIVIIISWLIQTFIYKGRVDDFNNTKIIQEKTSEMEKLYEELKKVNQELELLAQKDGLTGLYNRLMFDRLLKSQWEQCIKGSSSLTLIMMDIDFFKSFNDTYGHQDGDNCIIKIAKVLLDFSTDSSNFVARYGGEEFSMVINDLSNERAFLIAEQIRKNVEELDIPHKMSSVAKHVTISLGVYTTIPSNNYSIEKFIKSADNALYKAKDENRNRVVVSK
ncbi:GGDEF domain-containing protein [Clostridium sp.]|uniref:GGDEF domain-containing protein n=1 Tax=Clostridium sp. TaxID=1506 RepID=UPI003D6CDAA8